MRQFRAMEWRADVQHQYARFYPKRLDSYLFDDLVVDGETAAFVAIDRSFGVVTCGWVEPETIHVFGTPLLSRLDAATRAWIVT